MPLAEFLQTQVMCELEVPVKVTLLLCFTSSGEKTIKGGSGLWPQNGTVTSALATSLLTVYQNMG